MAAYSDRSSLFPLQALGRAVKQRPTFLLGLCGVRSLTNENNRTIDVTESTNDTGWNYSLNLAIDSMTRHWGHTPSLIPHHDLFSVGTSASNSRTRYGDAESIARWRSLPLCVLDLGCDRTETIKRYGRQCDGVAMIVLGSLQVAKKRLQQLRSDAIPWIGYWTVAFHADSSNNPDLDSVHNAA